MNKKKWDQIIRSVLKGFEIRGVRIREVPLVKEQQHRLVCDVLLDQSILPGVGNIIKNEALFDSGIKPSSKVSELKDEHVSHLIKMTRDFTNIFYQCRRDGKPLHVHYKIYSKRKCKQCDGKVTICRLGDDSDRVTYFCQACQTNDLRNKQRKLPMKGSLLGWVKTGNDDSTTTTEQTEWSCDICTFINEASSTTCNICLNPRLKSSTLSATGLQDSDDCVILDKNEVIQPAKNRKRLLSGNVESEKLVKSRKVDRTGVLTSNAVTAATNDQSKFRSQMKSTNNISD